VKPFVADPDLGRTLCPVYYHPVRRFAPTVGPEPRFRAQLRQWRESRGLTQDQAAEIFGVSPSTICRWELGYHHMPDWVVERLGLS
jgi:hypothetical protein